MKSNVILYLLIFIFIACHADKSCRDFRTGKFIYEASGNEWVVERNDSIQTEYCEEIGIKTELNISWINECTYVLKLNKILQNQPGIETDNNYIVHSSIIQTGHNFFVTESKVQGHEPQKHKFTLMK